MAIYLNNNVGVKLATNAAPTVPSIDISSYVTNAVINQIVDELEVTAMGQGGNPIKTMIGSARNFFAGILFIIPGVITDFFAIILLLIPIKDKASQNIQPTEEDVIEGEYRRDDELLK